MSYNRPQSKDLYQRLGGPPSFSAQASINSIGASPPARQKTGNDLQQFGDALEKMGFAAGKWMKVMGDKEEKEGLKEGQAKALKAWRKEGLSAFKDLAKSGVVEYGSSGFVRHGALMTGGALYANSATTLATLQEGLEVEAKALAGRGASLEYFNEWRDRILADKVDKLLNADEVPDSSWFVDEGFNPVIQGVLNKEAKRLTGIYTTAVTGELITNFGNTIQQSLRAAGEAKDVESQLREYRNLLTWASGGKVFLKGEKSGEDGDIGYSHYDGAAPKDLYPGDWREFFFGHIKNHLMGDVVKGKNSIHRAQSLAIAKARLDLIGSLREPGSNTPLEAGNMADKYIALRHHLNTELSLAKASEKGQITAAEEELKAYAALLARELWVNGFAGSRAVPREGLEVGENVVPTVITQGIKETVNMFESIQAGQVKDPLDPNNYLVWAAKDEKTRINSEGQTVDNEMFEHPYAPTRAMMEVYESSLAVEGVMDDITKINEAIKGVSVSVEAKRKYNLSTLDAEQQKIASSIIDVIKNRLDTPALPGLAGGVPALAQTTMWSDELIHDHVTSLGTDILRLKGKFGLAANLNKTTSIIRKHLNENYGEFYSAEPTEKFAEILQEISDPLNRIGQALRKKAIEGDDSFLNEVIRNRGASPADAAGLLAMLSDQMKPYVSHLTFFGTSKGNMAKHKFGTQIFSEPNEGITTGYLRGGAAAGTAFNLLSPVNNNHVIFMHQMDSFFMKEYYRAILNLGQRTGYRATDPQFTATLDQLLYDRSGNPIQYTPPGSTTPITIAPKSLYLQFIDKGRFTNVPARTVLGIFQPARTVPHTSWKAKIEWMKANP